MSGINFLYSVINFLILAGALYFFAGKKVKNMLNTHREKIEAELISANEARNSAEKLSSELERRECSNRNQRELIMGNARDQAKASGDVFIEGVRRDAEAIVSNVRDNEELLRREMKAGVVADAVGELTALAKTELRKAKYSSARERMAETYMGQIGTHIVAMPSDLLNLREGRRLKVTLSSPEPLAVESVQQIADTLCDRLFSFEISEDGAEPGIVSLQIGERVYSGTLDSILEKLDLCVTEEGDSPTGPISKEIAG